MTVHAIFHTATTAHEDEDRLVAICRDAQTAESLRASLATQPGFRDHVDGFVIDVCELDQDEWRQGFAWDDEVGEVEKPVINIVDVDDNPDVFVVQHRRLTGRNEQLCLIGIYSSRDAATAAIVRASALPGFRSFVDGFVTLGLALDVVHWANGFGKRDAVLQRLLSCSVRSTK